MVFPLLLVLLLPSLVPDVAAAKCRRITVSVGDPFRPTCPRGFDSTGVSCVSRCSDIPSYTPEGTGCRQVGDHGREGCLRSVLDQRAP